MDHEKSHGLWWASAPPPPPTAPLDGEIEADVVIVGGGFTGLSAALHLAEAGARAVVLEAKEIGFGGSGRNVGLVNAGLWVMPDDLPARLGDVLGERLLGQLGDAPGLVFDLVERHGIACEATRAGTLHCAVGAAGLREIAERARQWQQRGAAVDLLDAHQARRAVGSDAYAGALLDRRAGTIQPLAYARGLAAAAIRTGAAVYDASPVTACRDLDDRWRVDTTGGSAIAPWVIVATDTYSAQAWSALRREQVRLPYFNMATPPLGDNLRRSILPGLQGAWDTRRILSSFRLDAAGRLVFGSVGALRGMGGRVHGDWGRRALARLFPQLGGIGFEQAWYGAIGMTDDALPRLHTHGRNIFSVSGYNGRGIAPGTSFGRDLARLAMGAVGVGDLSLPLSAIKAPPFGALHEAAYEIGAQAAHLAAARL